MTEIQYVSESAVSLIDAMGSDARVAAAARISTKGELAEILCREDVEGDAEKDAGLIDYLIRNRHASPFEHVTMTFLISTPIVVAREFFRHRTWSFNEESGRYREMRPVFYVPSDRRPLVQVGKPGAYTFEQGSPEQMMLAYQYLGINAMESFERYRDLLEQGVAKEVARMVLPLTLMTSFYGTVNLRNAFNFLSLRTTNDTASVPSFPMHEIAEVADKIEEYVSRLAPLSHGSWTKNGRTSL